MAPEIELEKFLNPPYPRTQVIRERVIVEEHNDSTLVSVETEYPTISIVNRPRQPISVSYACGNVDTWRLIGADETRALGSVRINLTKFLNCRNVDFGDIGELENANFMSSLLLFVATAQSSNPVFVTYELEMSEIAIPPQGEGQIAPAFVPSAAHDISVIVRSWNHDGTPKPSVQFSWLAIGEKTALFNP